MEMEQWWWEPPDGSEPLEALVATHLGVRLIVLPQRGGKLVSLYHLPTQTEWFWLNPHLPWKAAAPTDSFVGMHDLGGWDECFPTVAPTTVGDRTWPDHGDLWWREWESEQRDETLWMGVAGEDYRFERTIRPLPDGLRFDYTVTNTGDTPLPYLWCAHPLLCVEPPIEIDLLERPRLLLGNDSALGKRGERHRWPRIAGRNVRQVGKPSGLAAKLFVEVETGEVLLHHANGVTLRLRWPVETLPFLGLWINEEGWSGADVPPYCNLGVEPATGAPDDLAVALDDWGTARHLPPGEQHRWWLHLSFRTEP